MVRPLYGSGKIAASLRTPTYQEIGIKIGGMLFWILRVSSGAVEKLISFSTAPFLFIYL